MLLAACAAAKPVPAPVPAAAPVPVPAPAAVPVPAPATATATGSGSGSDPAPTRPESTAGLYWLPYSTCYDCTAPVALAAYVTPSEREARAITHALAGKLALGLPYVVHTEELGLARRPAIAVVLGSFSSRAGADAARVAAPVLGGRRPIVLDIPSENGDGDGGGAYVESPHHVTVVDRGGAVPAYSPKDVQAAEAAVDGGSFDTIDAMHDAARRAIAPRHPLCTLQPGDLFVVRDADVKWYDFAPVRCGGRLAYVAWTSSLLGHAVIVRDASGSARLSQVVGAECDRPIIRDWPYDDHGRHDDPPSPDAPAGKPSVLASSGC